MGDSSQTAAAASSAPASTNYGGMSMTAVGGLTSGYAQLQSGRYNRRAANINAKLDEQQAAQAIQAGTFAANRVANREQRLEGADRAAAAGSGVVAGAGSNAAVMRSNEAGSNMDRMLIQLNARRQAFGFNARADAAEQEGRMANLQGEMGAASTLLNAGDQMWLESDPNYAGFRGRGISFGH